jgi:hypothetical protein
MYVCTVPYLPRLYPCTYLPLLFQGVSASDLPTKSISLIPTKVPGTNLFEFEISRVKSWKSAPLFAPNFYPVSQPSQLVSRKPTEDNDNQNHLSDRWKHWHWPGPVPTIVGRPRLQRHHGFTFDGTRGTRHENHNRCPSRSSRIHL